MTTKKIVVLSTTSSIVVGLILIVLFIYGVTLRNYPGTPEGVLIEDSKRSENLLPITVVDYGSELLGFQYATKHSSRGLIASKIKPVRLLGVTRYGFGTARPGCYYWQVDASGYELRQAQLADRKIIYGLANEDGKSKIPIDICDVIELDVSGQTYYFFYEKP